MAVMTRSAPVGASTLDRAARTVEAVLSTGAAVQRRGPRPDGDWGPWVEKLDLGTFDPRSVVGAPILRDHVPEVANVVGKVEHARVEQGSLVARIKFDASPDADRLMDQISGGFVTGVSIGYEIGTWEQANG